MANESKLKLPEKYILILESLPEQGMGYHLVNIFLASGKILKNRTILNSTFLKLENNEIIDPDSIVEINLVDDKYNR